jgi:hypothetical protein
MRSGKERSGSDDLMDDPVDRLLREARSLSLDDRARIAAELLATLGPAVPSHERSDVDWILEIERRARAAIAGSSALSRAEARAQIQDRLSNS